MNRTSRIGKAHACAALLTLVAVSCSPNPGTGSAGREDPAVKGLGEKSEPPGGRRSGAGLKLPVHFEPNQGQTDPEVRFLSRGAGHTVFLTSTAALFSIPSPRRSAVAGPADALAASRNPGSVVRMELVGATKPESISGLDRLSGRSNYIRGSDPRGWHTGVPNFSRVAYRGVYPGIDLIYHGRKGNLEYDFVVAPKADPGTIKVSFGKKSRLSLTPKGDLIVLAPSGAKLRHPKPFIYQESEGKRTRITGRYVLLGKGEFGFSVGAYDKRRPLIIDPVVLVYSTYLGGGDAEIGEDLAVDRSGNVYVTGTTTSTNFPASKSIGPGGVDGNPQAVLSDVFITKIDPGVPGAGRASLVYSTYLGAAGDDIGLSIAVDPQGHAYVTGQTTSSEADFPLHNPWRDSVAPTTFFGIQKRGFLMKVSLDGSRPEYSTLIPGLPRGVAVDTLGRAHLTGRIHTGDLEATANGFQSQRQGPSDVFVIRMTAPGDGLSYSTYLGGLLESGGIYETGNDIALDSAGKIYVAGTTRASDFPLRNPFQPARIGTEDPFLSKLDPDALNGPLSLLYSTFLGGGANLSNCPVAGTSNYCEEGTSVAVDASGNAYLGGYTGTDKFPVTLDAYQGTISRPPGYIPQSGVDSLFDGFVAKFNPALPGPASLLYSTYFGGQRDEVIRSIAVEPVDPPTGNVHLTGITFSRPAPHAEAFPLAREIDGSFGGKSEAFVAKLKVGGASGPPLLYSTYLGGSVGAGANGWERGEMNLNIRCCSGSGDPSDNWGMEVANSIQADATGSVYVAGTTASDDMFDDANGFQDQKAKGEDPFRESDAFVAKIDPPPALPPAIGGLSANQGSSCGGDVIKINGSEFWPPVIVEFSRTSLTGEVVRKPAQSVDVKEGGTQIVVTTPPHEPGPAEVIVKTSKDPPAKAPFVYIPALCQALTVDVPELPDGGGDGDISVPDNESEDTQGGTSRPGQEKGGAVPGAPPGPPAPAPVQIPVQAPVFSAVPGSSPAPGSAFAPAAPSVPNVVAGSLQTGLAELGASAQSAASPGFGVEAGDKEESPAPRYLMSALSENLVAAVLASAGLMLLMSCTVAFERGLRGRSMDPALAAAPAPQRAY